jgi:hypothetical protein
MGNPRWIADKAHQRRYLGGVAMEVCTMTSHNGDIELVDGCAVSMGEGVFVVTQGSDDGPHNVVITKDDLLKLLEAA